MSTSGRFLREPVRCAADDIRQCCGSTFPVATFENAYSLIGSDSFVDWSLYAWRPNTLGPDHCRVHHCPGDGLDFDTMGGLSPWLSAPARDSMVRCRGMAGLLSSGLLLVVVFLRRLCAWYFHRGRVHRHVRGVVRYRRRLLHVHHPGARGAQRRHLWFGPMGRGQGNPCCRIARPRWRGPGKTQQGLSTT